MILLRSASNCTGLGVSHTELTVSKNRTGYHNHINSQEVTELIRELALASEDTSIVSILNRLGYRTGNGNTWTEKRVQHFRHTNGFPACPPPDQRLWITMQQAAATLRVSEMVVRRLIAQKSLPAKQIVKFAPWMIERSHLDLPSVRKEIRRVHEGRRTGWAVSEKQTGPNVTDRGRAARPAQLKRRKPCRNFVVVRGRYCVIFRYRPPSRPN
jgi:hypothetical protein